VDLLPIAGPPPPSHASRPAVPAFDVGVPDGV